MSFLGFSSGIGWSRAEGLAEKEFLRASDDHSATGAESCEGRGWIDGDGIQMTPLRPL